MRARLSGSRRFVLGKQGRAILEKYGYSFPKTPEQRAVDYLSGEVPRWVS